MICSHKLFKNIDLIKIIINKKFYAFCAIKKAQKCYINLTFALKKGF